MSYWQITLAILFAIFVVMYLSLTAGRLDRLHHRVEVARETLNTQLARRLAAARAIASSGYLDPVTSLVIADACEGCVQAEGADEVVRGLAESELSRVLRAAFADSVVADDVRSRPGGDALANDLEASCARVSLARRFHNDAVGATHHMRSRRPVRYFRLAGSAPNPTTFEMDDSPPVGLG